jgi:hypothetical protein
MNTLTTTKKKLSPEQTFEHCIADLLNRQTKELKEKKENNQWKKLKN